MQAYTDASREHDPYALPDLEVFHVSKREAARCRDEAIAEGCETNGEGLPVDQPGTFEPGWYYWACFPGCMPDSEPVGPFDSEAAALADARESAGFCAHGVADDEPCETCDAAERSQDARRARNAPRPGLAEAEREGGRS